MSLLHSPLLTIGITGGIGSGKSYICRQLEAAGHPVFYCDDEAKRIIRTHAEVKAALTSLVGPEVYDADGCLVKSVLAAYLCKGRAYATQVDRIVHPKVAEAFQQRAQQMAQQLPPAPPASTAIATLTSATDWLEPLLALPTGSVLFMECALLFESGFDRLVDRSVLVHVSHETQINRLMARDHISREKAQAWIDLQLSEDEKLQRAHGVIHND